MTAILSKYKNVAVGGALALLGGGTLWAVADFPWDVPAAQSAALLPRFVAFGLILIGLFLMTSNFVNRLLGRGPREEDAEGVPIDVEIPEELLAEHEEEVSDWRVFLILAGLVIAYCFTAFTVGFITCTLIFVAAVALLLGHKRNVKQLIILAVFAVLVTAMFYYGFFHLLSVRPPLTPLP